MSDFQTQLNALQVRQRLGTEGKPLGRTTLDRWQVNDPTFPKPFIIGRERRWFADEIQNWILTRERRQYAGNAA